MKSILYLSLAVLLAACNKVSVENYDQLKVGMPYVDVKKVLGPAEKCSDVLGVKQCIWGNEQRHIDVSFIGDKTVFFTAENIR